MNVTHVSPSELSISSFEDARARQLELMAEYAKIEGFELKSSYDLNLKETQKHLKDLFWRVTEELAEADYATPGPHRKEELADALHFFLEAMILTETLVTRPPTRPDDEPSLEPWNVVSELGWAANFLKNKAWKQTQVQTDVKSFSEVMANAWGTFVNFLRSEFESDEELLEYYDRKSIVNKFRIRSRY